MMMQQNLFVCLACCLHDLQMDTSQHAYLRLITPLPRASLHRPERLCCVFLGKEHKNLSILADRLALRN